jgi:hypothetical protein
MAFASGYYSRNDDRSRSDRIWRNRGADAKVEAGPDGRG